MRVGWRDDPVNPEFYSPKKDSLKIRVKLTLDRERETEKGKHLADSSGRSQKGTLCLRSSYGEVAHTPVDGSTPMHTWSTLIGLEGLLIIIFVFKKDMKSGGRWVAGSQREVVRGGQDLNTLLICMKFSKIK